MSVASSYIYWKTLKNYTTLKQNTLSKDYLPGIEEAKIMLRFSITREFVHHGDWFAFQSYVLLIRSK